MPRCRLRAPQLVILWLMSAPLSPTSPAASSAFACTSMTGFGQGRGEIAGRCFQLRLRSVNHRFLDIHYRLPEEVEPFTAAMEKLLKQHLHRGHVDVTFLWEKGGTASGVRIDTALARSYLEAYNALSRDLQGPSAKIPAPAAMELLRLPGVVSPNGEFAGDDEQAQRQFEQALLPALESALGQLTEMRLREGAELLRDIRGRLQMLASGAEEIASLREQIRQALFDKLRKRLDELLAGAVPQERLAQEAALLADRSDISEEITRLRTHLGQFGEILRQGGETGKRLDFLLQEINREVNTLLSKTGSIAGEGLRLSELGVNMKAELEKIREQVQNLE